MKCWCAFTLKCWIGVMVLLLFSNTAGRRISWLLLSPVQLYLWTLRAAVET